MTMTITARVSALTAALLTGTALSTTALAQDQDGDRNDTIIVTVQKAEQARIDVPINLSVYSGSFLDELGVDQFDELSDFVPGFEVQEQSPNNPGFVIRGITSDSGGSGDEARVAVFQDGVSISKSRGSYVELFDVERVEVAKGPQPTLFGRGALIGGVNIIQNKATYDFAAEAEVGYGSDNFQLVEGFVNTPLIEDVAALRLAGIFKQRDGYVDNALGGDDFNGVGVAAVRGSLRLDPTEKLGVDLIINYQEDDTPGTSFRTNNPGLDASTSPFAPASLNTFGGFEGGQDLGLERTVWGVTAIAEYEISDALSLTSITGYREFDSTEIFDPDGYAGELLVAGENAEGEQWSQELRLNFDNGDRLRGFVGVNYFWEDGFQRIPLATNEAFAQAFNAPLLVEDASVEAGIAGAIGLPYFPAPMSEAELAANQFVDDLVTVPFVENLIAQSLYGELVSAGAPVPLIDPAAASTDQLNAILVGAGLDAVDLDDLVDPYPLNVGALLLGLQAPTNPFYLEETTNFGETTSYDLFGDVTYDVTDKLSLTAGLRWTHDRKKAGVQGDNVNGPNSITGAQTLFIPATPDGALFTFSDEFDDFTWRLVGAYRVNDDLNVWSSYARGRRPEVLTFDASSETLFDVVPAETVDSFEVGGFANLFGGSTQVNVSTFYSTYENFQTSVFLPDTATFVTSNAGEATQYGLEGEVFASVAPWADVFFTYGYNFAEFDGENLEFDGNVFRLNPEHAVAIGAQMSWEIAGAGSISLTPTYTWQSEIFFDNDNDNDLTDGDGGITGVAVDEVQDAYGLANVRLRFDDASGRYSAELFVTNAFDEEYIIDAGNTGDSFGIPTFIAGAPQQYGASIRVRF